MNQSLLTVLQDILSQYGTPIVDDPRRMESLLRDMAAGAPRSEIACLIAAVRARVPQLLAGSAPTLPIELIEGQMVQRMLNDVPFTEDAAREAVQLWALALGRRTTVDAVRPKTEPRQVPPPPPPRDAWMTPPAPGGGPPVAIPVGPIRPTPPAMPVRATPPAPPPMDHTPIPPRQSHRDGYSNRPIQRGRDRQPTSGGMSGLVIGLICGSVLLVGVCAVLAVLILGGSRKSVEEPDTKIALKKVEIDKPKTTIVEKVKPGPLFLTLLNGYGRVGGALTADDQMDVRGENRPCKIYKVQLRSGKTYRIDHKSTAYDSFLRLEDPDGTQVARDDDGGDGLNAKIVYSCKRDGEYSIFAATHTGILGAFELEVRELADVGSESIALVRGRAVLNRTFEASDKNDPLTTHRCKVYSVWMDKGKTYRFDQQSIVIDPFLRLTTADGSALRDNDNGADKFTWNARMIHDCKITGEYRVYASAKPVLGLNTGAFTLIVAEEPKDTPLVLVNKVAVPSGRLTTDLPYEPVRNVPGHTYSIKLQAKKTYQIDLRSKDFDAYLRLEDGWGCQLAVDDDSGGNLNARIRYTTDKEGLYFIYVSGLSGGTGAFELDVVEQ